MKRQLENKIGKRFWFSLDMRNNVLREPETYVLEKHGRRCKVIGKGTDGWDWLVSFGKSWGDRLLAKDNELIPLRSG